MRILVLYSGELGRKVIQNLINSSNFCVSCGELCNHCRQARKSYANLIVGIHEFQDDLPPFIEEPSQFMPPKLPECDLILAIGIHPDLLAAVPEVVQKTGAKAVIAPAEDSKKTPAGSLSSSEKNLKPQVSSLRLQNPSVPLKKNRKAGNRRFRGSRLWKAGSQDRDESRWEDVHRSRRAQGCPLRLNLVCRKKTQLDRPSGIQRNHLRRSPFLSLHREHG